jgi:hypothetical protein
MRLNVHGKERVVQNVTCGRDHRLGEIKQVGGHMLYKYAYISTPL